MSKVNLIFGTHNSQPAGSDDYQFEKAYQEAYKPFLTILYNFPLIPVVLHYSGILLEWLEENHPEFIMLLNEMVKRKQVEILGGGYYDPILPMIPSADRIGQLEYLTTFIRKRFGKRPRGCWITEKIWDQSLTYMFSSSGMDYIFLDDLQFTASGCGADDLFSPCITEDQGKTLNVFPLSTAFDELIPEQSPKDVVEQIIGIGKTIQNPVVTILQKGENYGLYNNSGKLCYHEGWFEQFFLILSEKADEIELIRPGTYLKENVPERKLFFPCTAESKIKQSLAEKKSNNGGCEHTPQFRQILIKYPESNLLYSKMIYTNILVNQIRGDKYRKKTAREELWKGQCHNPYWHGLPHGIYNNRLRKAAYGALIEAEKITHEKGIFIPSILTVDFDMDGRKEYLYQGNDLNAYIHAKGGMLFELDYLPKCWNYLDTITRQKEYYHHDLSETVIFDRYQRKSFIDHFFNRNDSIGQFYSMQYQELGGFIGKSYQEDDFDRDRKRIALSAEDMVSCSSGDVRTLMKKVYNFSNDNLLIQYTLQNRDEKPAEYLFGTEINFAFASKGMESQRIYNTSRQRTEELGIDQSVHDNVSELSIDDVANNITISLKSEIAGELWILPIETFSLGEYGFETRYQSTCFVPRWNITLEPLEIWSNEIFIEINEQ